MYVQFLCSLVQKIEHPVVKRQRPHKGSFTLSQSERESEFLLSSLKLLNMNIKLDSL